MNTNNKIYTRLIVLFLSGLLLNSCSEDATEVINEIDVLESSLNGEGLEVITYGRSNITGKGNRFVGAVIATFESEEVFNDYSEELEAQVDAWDDAFVAQWNHLNDDDLNAKEEELNFDSEKPLTDFENLYGLNSLRQKYLAAEDIWLANDVLNELTDPDNDPIFISDNINMTLLNELGEVKIGNIIYKQLNSDEITALSITSKNSSNSKVMRIEEDAVLVIDDGDFDTLIDFNSGDTSVIDDDNVTVVKSTASDCRSGRSIRKSFYLPNNKKIRAVVKARSGFLGGNGRLKAKTKSYKKGGISGWKRWRTTIYAGLKGTVLNHCEIPKYINEGETKRRKKVVYYWKNIYYSSHGVENGGMNGVHTQNGETRELTLTW